MAETGDAGAGRQTQAVVLCPSAALENSGSALGFFVRYLGRKQSAFAVRYQGQVVAYLNRCTHVPMEMDYQAGQFFDLTGQWLICGTHGALHAPLSGACVGGPCRGGLVKIQTSEIEGIVRWHTAASIDIADE